MRRHSSKKLIVNKALGQHFLINESVKAKILTYCALEPTDTVLEIGPGQGAMTSLLGDRVAAVVAVEKDERLASALQEKFAATNVTVVHEDFLAYTLEVLPPSTKVVGNLPYNISTPIIEKILGHRPQFSIFYFMVQLEYGQRLVATPHTKTYGSLSCLAQYYADVSMFFKIRPSAFDPPPKVQSCFMQMAMPAQRDYAADDERHLFQLIRRAFAQRRKTLVNALAGWVSREILIPILDELHLNVKYRAENYQVEDFVRLSNALIALKV